MQPTPQETLTLSEKIAGQAEFVVNNFKQTRYTHEENINIETAVYDCDCSEFVGFVLKQAAPDHYSSIAATAPAPRPLAFDYFTFFSDLTPESAGGWRRVNALLDARRGDVVAWRAPEIEPKHNTGHCFFLAETPFVMNSGKIAVRVYDSAAASHFDDTRLDGETGVGSGFINFELDGEGRPIAFQFGPSPETNKFVAWQIAIGRVQPESEG
jgi:hypothetical protein